MSIEGIALENFSAPTQKEKSVTPQERTSHTVFHSFLSDDSKQDAATTIEHSKRVIDFFQQHNSMYNLLSTIC